MAFIHYQVILFSSLFYEELLQLRQDLLRTPLGLTLDFNQMKTDYIDWHIGACESGKLVGAVSLTPKSSRLIRMRQMAIAPAYQSLGIGRRLVRKAEELAMNEGYETLTLDARETALGFYDKLDYHQVGQTFIKSGIPHIEMNKSLI